MSFAFFFCCEFCALTKRQCVNFTNGRMISFIVLQISASVSEKLFPQSKDRCFLKNRPSENSFLSLSPLHTAPKMGHVQKNASIRIYRTETGLNVKIPLGAAAN